MSTNIASLPPTLRRAAVPRQNVATSALLVLGGAGFVALFAQISIQLPFTPVPVTGQTFAVLLVAASLGLVHGTLAMLAYILMGTVGLPVFADQAHGWDVVIGATGGYLIGFLVAGALVGGLAERRWDRSVSSSVSAMLTGSVIIYLAGLVWLSAWLGDNGFDNGLNATLEAGLYPFIAGDIVKLYLAAALLPLAWRLVERIKRG
jgi:biotin transport system substrate-specific component